MALKHKVLVVSVLAGLPPRVVDAVAQIVEPLCNITGREVRMAELKESIQKLREQLESAGLTPVAVDPLKETGKAKS